MNPRKLIPALILTLAVWLPPAAAQSTTQPLLQPNKKTLFQRVLSRPGAALRSEPSAGKQGLHAIPFTAYYVYAREQRDGAEWLKVGVDTRGKGLSWIPAADTLAWNQALTVAFKNPIDHDRVLLFKEKDTLRSLAAGPDMDTYRALYNDALNAASTAESPVVAVQPEAHLDIQDDFYLVPIVDHEDTFMGGEKARILEVSTVPLRTSNKQAVSAETGEAGDAPDPYRSGIVFVIDSTTSMGPYIDRTREAVRGIYQSIESAGLSEKVSFGLVAYRDSLDAVPALEYLSRTYSDLEAGLSADGFFSRVNNVRPAEVSSRGFTEDAYAGVRRAIEDMDWSPYSARYVVLITDAGPRPGNDPLSSTGMSGNALRQLALDKGVSLWALHLKTPEGRRDHGIAEARYRAVSTYPGIGDFYYGVDAGDVGQFGNVLETLANQITQQVKDTADGKEPKISIPENEAATDPSLTSLREKVSKLGYA
ncbi:MAG: vWA domain-containing protein, partial [Gammaproteobacteria bacterium]